MKLTEDIIKQIEDAEGKALATCCAGEINVVPVSVVRVVKGKIWLHDFFMNKTAKNVCQEPQAALALWNGLEGVQIKGTVEYETSGANFDEATAWIKENFPDRKLRGLLVFDPQKAYDVSAGGNAGQQLP